jgi:hypothetical protein
VTPIKEIWVIEHTVFALDYADQLNFMAQCADHQSALVVGILLSQRHGKQVFAFKPSMRRMVPVGESN